MHHYSIEIVQPRSDMLKNHTNLAYNSPIASGNKSKHKQTTCSRKFIRNIQ